MGYEFDENGKYIGWSDIFDYTSVDTLQASEKLPMPQGNIYTQDNEKGIDISEQLKTMPTDSAKRLEFLADLLIKLQQSTHILKWDSDLDSIGKEVLEDLNKHERTKLPAKVAPLALRNLVSTNIQTIVQSLKNMDKAYTQITMDTLKQTAPKESLTTSLLNPMSKFIMQEQNMVGKNVIGIAAVAEKVFFNLSYYWNEGIRSGNQNWIDNLKFANTFKRIQDRYKGIPTEVTKIALSNVNFEGNQELFNVFTNALTDTASLLQQAIANGEMTQEDIDTNSETFQRVKAKIDQQIKDHYNGSVETDDLISQLLSAATDNAKELILAKLNCTSDLAKHYFYLLMVGFDIKDIIKFMTSDTVNLVKNLLQANVFDEFLPSQTINSVLQILHGNFPVNNYLGQLQRDYEGNIESYADKILYKLRDKLATDLFQLNPEAFGKKDSQGKLSPKRYTNLSYLLKDYFIAQTSTEGLPKSLKEYLGYDSTFITDTLRWSPADRNMYALCNYVEYVISQVKKCIDFREDLEEFEKINGYANETTTLGKLLGLNQGFKTKREEKLATLFSIQGIIGTKIRELGLTKKDMSDKSKVKDIVVSSYVEKQLKLRPATSTEEIEAIKSKASKIYDEADELGIVDKFDIIRWAQDKSYQVTTSKFYNLIKGTWNIFDVIAKVPQYKAIFELLNTITVAERGLITKARLVDDICLDLMHNKNVLLSADKIKQLSSYVDQLLIKHWFDKTPISFTLKKGFTRFNKDYSAEEIKEDSSVILLNSEQNRSTFKYAMEHEILHALQSKDFFGQGDLSENPFVKNLLVDVDMNDKPFLRLNLDMQNIDITTANSKKFQDCLNGFRNLQKIKYEGIPITDLLMLYNYLVNKNMYGEYRMTTLFASFVESSDVNSVISKIFQAVGSMDYDGNLSLYDLDYNPQDAQYYMAPLISVNQENLSKDLMIREINNGHIHIKYRSDSFRQFNNGTQLITDKKAGESLEDFEKRYKNFIEYSCIDLPFHNKVSTFVSGLQSNNSSEVIATLRDLIRKGIITITRENC